MKIAFITKDMFLDAKHIAESMDAKTNRVLKLTGGYGRKVMRNNMRVRKKPSPPGGYPAARGNRLLRENIQFGVNGSKELLIGPTRINNTDPEVVAAGLTVPELLNAGGTITRFRAYIEAINRIVPTKKPVRWHYRPRPFVALTRPHVARKLAENIKNVPLK